MHRVGIEAAPTGIEPDVGVGQQRTELFGVARRSPISCWHCAMRVKGSSGPRSLLDADHVCAEIGKQPRGGEPGPVRRVHDPKAAQR